MSGAGSGRWVVQATPGEEEWHAGEDKTSGKRVEGQLKLSVGPLMSTAPLLASHDIQGEVELDGTTQALGTRKGGLRPGESLRGQGEAVLAACIRQFTKMRCLRWAGDGGEDLRQRGGQWMDKGTDEQKDRRE